MPRTNSRARSSTEIERSIVTQIAEGIYKPGDQLPTCKELGLDYGADKNTVNRAYRSLVERGYLSTRAGIGTFVTRRPALVDAGGAEDEARYLVQLAVQSAKLGGVPAARFEAIVAAAVAAGFSRGGPRLGFVECNKVDAAALSRDLQAMLGHPVQPLLIDQVLADPANHLRRYDILAVNLSHLAALEEGLRRFKPERRADIVGLHIVIDPDCLIKIARLKPGTVLGVLCDLEQTLHALTGTVRGLNPALDLRGGISADRQAVAAMLGRVDVLLVTPSAAERIGLEDVEPPVIPVLFQINERAIADLSRRVSSWREDRAAH